MGISGLLPLLKEVQVSGHISEFKGKRLAVDAYVWLHKGAFGCAADLVKGNPTTKFVDYAMYRVRMLKYHGIIPFIVFDGGPLPAKKGTEVSRAASRKANLEKAMALESQGRYADAREAYTKCVDITPEVAFQFIKALRAENIDYVVAPYEADAQLCFLEKEGLVDGIITEDSDLLVFGCKQVIFKLDKDGKCIWIHREKLAKIRDFPMYGWTDTQFRRMAMLSGCDYLDSIPGMGLKTAYKLLRRHKTVERLFQQIRLDGNMQIPQNYQKDFAQAELAFLHQRVFDPVEQRLVPLYDFPEGGLDSEDEKWVGIDKPVDIARGVARGDLHPETELPIFDMYKDQKGMVPRNFTNSTSRPVLGESSKSNVQAGPMDAFILRSKKRPAPILPTPVGTFGSGVKTLYDLSFGMTKAARKRPLPSDAEDIWENSQMAKIGGEAKTSKFFAGEGGGEQKKTLTGGEPGCQNQDENAAGPSRPAVKSRSASLEFEHIRSPSPVISSFGGRCSQTDLDVDVASQSDSLNLSKAKTESIHQRDSQSQNNDLDLDDTFMPHLSSPAGPPVSSPAITTPPKSDPRGRRDSSFTFSPSPTRCSSAVDLDLWNTRAPAEPRNGDEMDAFEHSSSGGGSGMTVEIKVGVEGRKVLIAQSSQYVSSPVSSSSQIGYLRTTKPEQTPPPRERKYHTLSRLGGVLIPPSSPGLGNQSSSSPAPVSTSLSMRARARPAIHQETRKMEPIHDTGNRSSDSWDSFAEEEEELVTPSLVGRIGGDLNDVETIDDDDDGEEEAEVDDGGVAEAGRRELERETRAKIVGAGLREKFGYKPMIQLSSSPSSSQGILPRRTVVPSSSSRSRKDSTSEWSTPQPTRSKLGSTSSMTPLSGILSSRHINLASTSAKRARPAQPRRLSETSTTMKSNMKALNDVRSEKRADANLNLDSRGIERRGQGVSTLDDDCFIGNAIDNDTGNEEKECCQGHGSRSEKQSGLTWKGLEKYRFAGKSARVS